MHDDVCRHRIGKAEVIGGRDAVDEHAGLVAPRQRVDDGSGIGIGRLAGQAVGPWLVVEPARDAADLLAARQPVKRLVDSLARAEVEEIDRRLGPEGGGLLHPIKDVRFQIQGIPAHRHFLCQKHIYGVRAERLVGSDQNYHASQMRDNSRPLIRTARPSGHTSVAARSSPPPAYLAGA